MQPTSEQVLARLASWEARSSRNAAIDADAKWSPAAYRFLYHASSVGQSAYYATNHWRVVASEQKRLEPECATCGGSPGGFVLQAHHVEGAYGNLGKERPGADLETLCKLCHMDLSPKSPHFGIIALLGECQREWDEWWHSMSPEEQQRYMDDAQAHGL